MDVMLNGARGVTHLSVINLPGPRSLRSGSAWSVEDVYIVVCKDDDWLANGILP